MKVEYNNVLNKTTPYVAWTKYDTERTFPKENGNKYDYGMVSGFVKKNGTKIRFKVETEFKNQFLFVLNKQATLTINGNTWYEEVLTEQCDGIGIYANVNTSTEFKLILFMNQ